MYPAADLLVGGEADSNRAMRNRGVFQQVFGHRHDDGDTGFVVGAEERVAAGRDDILADLAGEIGSFLSQNGDVVRQDEIAALVVAMHDRPDSAGWKCGGGIDMGQEGDGGHLVLDRRRNGGDRRAVVGEVHVAGSQCLQLSNQHPLQVELDRSACDLGELLREMHLVHSALVQDRPIVLQLELGEGVEGQVLGDPMRTRQILRNYLDNALKFTERGEVRLAARRLDAQRVRLEVHDTGAGIDADTQALLFRPFSQADASLTKRHGGTGLGLSICRELAALMGGEVGVHSQPQQGSCFWAELPLPATATPAPAPDALHGATVLVVEDDPVNMMIATTLLEQWGVRTERAADGRQALQAVQRQAEAGHLVDAILMDVMMPGMSGHETSRLLRREYGAERLPIIALTAAANEREQALAAGMNDFVLKPIDAPLLRQALARWIGLRRGGPPQDSAVGA